MSWQDLHEDILGEFAERAATVIEIRDNAGFMFDTVDVAARQKRQRERNKEPLVKAKRRELERNKWATNPEFAERRRQANRDRRARQKAERLAAQVAA